ncbi:MAG: hypothetical protein V3V28_13730 [Polaribacter sp.]|uniref:hypothetical protein n=1 Tax=Polaribacter sp. TaxID=1920175 RepID=UPI002F351916
MLVNIKADFTCDNSYSIWIGDENSVHTKITQATNTQASQIFNGEHINFNALKPEYLYVIAWSDDSTKQGLIGSFSGGITINTGNPLWEVLPTKSNKDNNQFPTKNEINSFVTPSVPLDWKKPFVGPTNANTSSIYSSVNPINGIDINANWVWHNSNNSSNPFVGGHNHDEFLVFRIPVKYLVGCSPCSDEGEKQTKTIKKRALEKHFTINGKGNNNKRCVEPHSKETCSMLDLPNLEPCFHMHWGDSKRDQIESHDDEILYITACNPYGNLSLRGLTITSINLIPNGRILSNGEKEIQIVPDKLICFGDLEGCICSSREFTLLTRGIKPGDYKIVLEYCIKSIEINQNNKGENAFEIEIINS